MSSPVSYLSNEIAAEAWTALFGSLTSNVPWVDKLLFKLPTKLQSLLAVAGGGVLPVAMVVAGGVTTDSLGCKTGVAAAPEAGC